MDKEYICKWCGLVLQEERDFCKEDHGKKFKKFQEKENKKLLNRENEKEKRMALKSSGLKKVVLFVRPDEILDLKRFDRSHEIWSKPKGRKKKETV